MVLNEPATRFYLFLEHAIKIEAENHYYQLQISQFPQLTEESQNKLFKQYENIINENEIQEPEIKIDDSEIKNDRERLKLLLKGN